jgi:hypothetical protein
MTRLLPVLTCALEPVADAAPPKAPVVELTDDQVDWIAGGHAWTFRIDASVLRQLFTVSGPFAPPAEGRQLGTVGDVPVLSRPGAR